MEWRSEHLDQRSMGNDMEIPSGSRFVITSKWVPTLHGYTGGAMSLTARNRKYRSISRRYLFLDPSKFRRSSASVAPKVFCAPSLQRARGRPTAPSRPCSPALAFQSRKLPSLRRLPPAQSLLCLRAHHQACSAFPQSLVLNRLRMPQHPPPSITPTQAPAAPSSASGAAIGGALLLILGFV